MKEIARVVVFLATLAAWLYRERENARERAALADRIQAPQAFQMAAMEQAFADTPAERPADIYTEPVPAEYHDDLRIQALLGEDQ